jgi:chemotaxis protein methyltransferase WspC
VAPPENSGTPRATGHATSPHPGASRQADSLLDQASALADSGQYNEAKALVDQAVADGFASARAYYLLGMLAQASGLRDLAEAHYLKAIYLDPQDDEALLALALLARRKGDVAAEAGYRRRAERVRSRKVIS